MYIILKLHLILNFIETIKHIIINILMKLLK